MITPADDLPLHQSARAFRDPGTDRNAYDRFFFNGYPLDGSAYFAVALGMYHGRNLKDAGFSVVVDGIQHNVRASTLLGDDRLDTSVGPIAVTIDEAFRRLSVRVDDEPSGISAELHFAARGPAFEEEPYRWGPGHRVSFDYTRLTQNGTWSGWITVGDHRLDLTPEEWWGTRDRSWGTRPLGPREADAPDGAAGFHWLWAPLQFDDASYLWDVNEWPDGRRWHGEALWAPVVAPGDDPLSAPVESGESTYAITWQPGTRRASSFSLELDFRSGKHHLTVEPLWCFTMNGIGYLHPSEGHGTWLGEGWRTHDSFSVAEVDVAMPWNFHVQAMSKVTRGDGATGVGILEQLVIGPHSPSGFADLFDLA